MSAVSLPVTRPIGRALVVGGASARGPLVQSLQALGYSCAEVDDPYAGILEMCRKQVVYRALILSLAGVFREELAVIQTVKTRFPQVEVWLTHTDGRQSSLAEAMRFGADGLLADDGLHRIAGASVVESSQPRPTADDHHPEDSNLDGIGEPVLTAEELRALLQEQPGSLRTD